MLRYCLQSGRSLSCPPTSQTVKATFLCSTFSTLKPAGIEQPTFASTRNACPISMLAASLPVSSYSNLPIVGTVDNTSATCSRYRIVVLPAASRPSITTYIGTRTREGTEKQPRKNSEPQVELNHGVVCSNGNGKGVVFVTFTSLWQELSKKSFIRDWPMLASVLYCPAPGPVVFFLTPPCSCVPARRVQSLFCAACVAALILAASFARFLLVFRDDLMNVELSPVVRLLAVEGDRRW